MVPPVQAPTFADSDSGQPWRLPSVLRPDPKMSSRKTHPRPPAPSPYTHPSRLPVGGPGLGKIALRGPRSVISSKPGQLSGAGGRVRARRQARATGCARWRFARWRAIITRSCGSPTSRCWPMVSRRFSIPRGHPVVLEKCHDPCANDAAHTFPPTPSGLPCLLGLGDSLDRARRVRRGSTTRLFQFRIYLCCGIFVFMGMTQENSWPNLNRAFQILNPALNLGAALLERRRSETTGRAPKALAGAVLAA